MFTHISRTVMIVDNTCWVWRTLIFRVRVSLSSDAIASPSQLDRLKELAGFLHLRAGRIRARIYQTHKREMEPFHPLVSFLCSSCSWWEILQGPRHPYKYSSMGYVN